MYLKEETVNRIIFPFYKRRIKFIRLIVSNNKNYIKLT